MPHACEGTHGPKQLAPRALLAPGGVLAICDIHADYVPTPMMAQGEPYVNGYLDHIEAEADAFYRSNDFLFMDRHELCKDRLVLWTFHLPVAERGSV